MGKKYRPSGYQIIDLGLTADGDDLLTADGGNVEDKSLLCDLLLKAVEKTTSKLSKPILLSFTQEDGETISGVATFRNYGDNTGELLIYDRQFEIYIECALSPTKSVTFNCTARE